MKQVKILFLLILFGLIGFVLGMLTVSLSSCSTDNLYRLDEMSREITGGK